MTKFIFLNLLGESDKLVLFLDVYARFTNNFDLIKKPLLKKPRISCLKPGFMKKAKKKFF